MSNINCPFDSQHCPTKERNFSAWGKFVTAYNIVAPIHADTFSGCPVGQTCPRHPEFLKQQQARMHEQR